MLTKQVLTVYTKRTVLTYKDSISRCPVKTAFSRLVMRAPGLNILREEEQKKLALVFTLFRSGRKDDDGFDVPTYPFSEHEFKPDGPSEIDPVLSHCTSSGALMKALISSLVVARVRSASQEWQGCCTGFSCQPAGTHLLLQCHLQMPVGRKNPHHWVPFRSQYFLLSRGMVSAKVL